jgi:hypothetical protein
MTAAQASTVGGIARPYLGVDGYVEAAIDIFIAEVGIRGDLNIITVSLPFRPVDRSRQQHALSTDPADYELSVNAPNSTWSSPRSPVPSRPTPRSAGAHSAIPGRKTIVDWTGPTWRTNLFDQTYTVTLADLFAALGG